MAVHDLIERVQVLSIDPDDVLIVKVKGDPTDDEIAEMAQGWRQAMPDNQVVIYRGADLDLRVLRAALADRLMSKER